MLRYIKGVLGIELLCEDKGHMEIRGHPNADWVGFPQIGALAQDTVFFLEAIWYPGKVRSNSWLLFQVLKLSINC